MGRRRLAREIALQALYVADVSRTPAADAFAMVIRREGNDADQDTLEFARVLALGTLERRDELDALIQERAANWAMNRMAAVDRNVLRLAAFEIVARPDTPLGVVMDEAIEIVRKYSTEEATRFVNGVLDALKSLREAPKPSKARKAKAPKKIDPPHEPAPENP
ncbi:MAG: transcription antitermination factor NusB [Elusimicrobia bacterium]|nr:transcription antitermination factor NusB [Elusimicrobiota bacterium]MDE2509736.1 transcription antitermination factor NusB [Elusimicrobiota bacterium]